MDCNYERIGDRMELVLEKELAHPPEKAWRALTERELLRQWFPCDVAGRWSVGESLQFIFPAGRHEGLAEEELRGEVLAVDPPHRLEFTWGKYQYLCELTAAGAGCRLRFIESFADPSETARSAAGWEMCLENLAAHLQGAEPSPFTLEAWQAKFEKYATQFEPALGPQLGAPEQGD